MGRDNIAVCEGVRLIDINSANPSVQNLFNFLISFTVFTAISYQFPVVEIFHRGIDRVSPRVD